MCACVRSSVKSFTSPYFGIYSTFWALCTKAIFRPYRDLFHNVHSVDRESFHKVQHSVRDSFHNVSLACDSFHKTRPACVRVVWWCVCGVEGGVLLGLMGV